MLMREEHPNPQFMRENYRSLNGVWDFEIASSAQAMYDAMGRELTGKINVPFCPEAKLSGIGYRDFITFCIYKRKFFLEPDETEKRIALNFGAIDYEAEVYINGTLTARHRGGYTPFCADITNAASEGENEIAVLVRDDVKDNLPSGKQSSKKDSFGCFYSRVTGIWQSVWLEFTPRDYIKSVEYSFDINKGIISIKPDVCGEGYFTAEIFYKGETKAKVSDYVVRTKRLNVQINDLKLWNPLAPELYDVKLTYNGDQVLSYFGAREVCYDGLKFKVNGKTVFQRFVLDQGYYEDGIYTAPDKKYFEDDIDRAIGLGFNGARLHQKIFEPMYLYYCDLKGFMVWEEMPSWGIRASDLNAAGDFLGEWREAMERDINHPCIITWCPLNETWEDLSDEKRKRDKRFVQIAYKFTKEIDGTRPCVDVSGGYHGRCTDLFDFHYYGDSQSIKQKIEQLDKSDVLDIPKLYADGEKNFYKDGQPVNVSEYGGIAFADNNDKQRDSAWGYTAIASDDEFADEYAKRTAAILRSPKISGFCYTQLYDVEQEQNGLFTYGRKFKFSDGIAERLKSVNKLPAAIETNNN